MLHGTISSGALVRVFSHMQFHCKFCMRMADAESSDSIFFRDWQFNKGLANSMKGLLDTCPCQREAALRSAESRRQS